VPIVNPARLTLSKPNQPINIVNDAKPSGDIALIFDDIRVLAHGTPGSQTLRSVIEALRQ
jgi:hypothetical protein